jgi:hypothetical protein
MQFEGAKIREQGITFGIIIVKSHVLHNTAEQVNVREFGARVFGSIPIVLMAQDSQGVPTYQGRPDIIRFLSGLHPGQIPWKKYTLSAA